MTKELFIQDIKVYCKTIIITNKKGSTHRNKPVEWNGLKAQKHTQMFIKTWCMIKVAAQWGGDKIFTTSFL